VSMPNSMPAAKSWGQTQTTNNSTSAADVTIANVSTLVMIRN